MNILYLGQSGGNIAINSCIDLHVNSVNLYKCPLTRCVYLRTGVIDTESEKYPYATTHVADVREGGFSFEGAVLNNPRGFDYDGSEFGVITNNKEDGSPLGEIVFYDSNYQYTNKRWALTFTSIGGISYDPSSDSWWVLAHGASYSCIYHEFKISGPTGRTKDFGAVNYYGMDMCCDGVHRYVTINRPSGNKKIITLSKYTLDWELVGTTVSFGARSAISWCSVAVDDKYVYVSSQDNVFFVRDKQDLSHVSSSTNLGVNSISVIENQKVVGAHMIKDGDESGVHVGIYDAVGIKEEKKNPDTGLPIYIRIK